MELPPASSQPLSVNQLARLHCGERLLVPPVYWTTRQLDLLQCSFTGPSPAPADVQPRFADHLNGSLFIARMIHHWKLTPKRDTSIVDLVSCYNLPLKPGEDLGFFFAGQTRKRLRCITFHDRQEAKLVERPLPVAAYVNRQRIQDLRRKTVYPRKDRRNREPVTHAYYMRKLKAITPANDLFDPYIVAVLIAIAQEHQTAARDNEVEQSKERGHDATFTARVLSSSKNKECMHLYSADIASSFLDMLNSPSVPPVSPTSVSVQITAISYKPYNTLRDRILAQLYPSWHGKPSQTNVAEEGAVEEKSEGVR